MQKYIENNNIVFLIINFEFFKIVVIIIIEN